MIVLSAIKYSELFNDLLESFHILQASVGAVIIVTNLLWFDLADLLQELITRHGMIRILHIFFGQDVRFSCHSNCGFFEVI